MANKQIRQFNEQTSLASSDIFLMQDGSTNETKKVTATTTQTFAFDTAKTWTSWTPTFTNWTIGSGGSAQTVAKYQRIGSTVFFTLNSTLGTSGASVGAGVYFSLPITAFAPPVTGTASHPLDAILWMEDTGVLNYQGGLTLSADGTVASLKVWKVDSTYMRDAANVTSTVPFTWGAGDSINISGHYRAA